MLLPAKSGEVRIPLEFPRCFEWNHWIGCKKKKKNKIGENYRIGTRRFIDRFSREKERESACARRGNPSAYSNEQFCSCSWVKGTRVGKRKLEEKYCIRIYIYIYRGEGINRMKKAVISSGRDE